MKPWTPGHYNTVIKGPFRQSRHRKQDYLSIITQHWVTWTKNKIRQKNWKTTTSIEHEEEQRFLMIKKYNFGVRWSCSVICLNWWSYRQESAAVCQLLPSVLTVKLCNWCIFLPFTSTNPNPKCFPFSTVTENELRKNYTFFFNFKLDIDFSYYI